MEDFVEYRNEQIDKQREKTGKDPKYDPEEEKNKWTGAEITDLPFGYVDIEFIDGFSKFLKGNNQKM